MPHSNLMERLLGNFCACQETAGFAVSAFVMAYTVSFNNTSLNP
jgi:hypothetical protein